MVIKKPYAFLIKNFKIIHIILFLLLTFIMVKYVSLFNFFNSYAKNEYYVYQSNLQSYYVGYVFLISLLLVLVIGVVLYLLLKWKDKPTKFYVWMCVYYFVIFIILMVSYSTLNISSLNTISIRSVRVYRDILGITMIFQLFFIVFSLIRGIGFDIKQFEFKKDLEELNIQAEDEEEIELVIVEDTYKFPRFFRKLARHIKYFIIEKRFWAIFIACFLVIITGLGIYLNKKVYNSEYKQQDTFTINYLNMKVTESYTSSIDYKGSIVTKGKTYLIVKLNVINSSSIGRKIETDKFVLKIGNEKIYPIFTKGNYFLDLGNSYNKEVIPSGEEKNVLLIYELEDNIKVSKCILNVLNQVVKENETVKATYKDVTLVPIDLNNIGIIDEYKIGDELLFGESALEKTTLTVDSFEFGTSFNEYYSYCISNLCFNNKKIMSSDIVGKSEKVIIKLSTTTNIDQNIAMNKYIKSSESIFDYFGSIKYIVDGNTKVSGINILKTSLVNSSNVYIEVPVKVKNASNIELFLTVRDDKYGIILK